MCYKTVHVGLYLAVAMTPCLISSGASESTAVRLIHKCITGEADAGIRAQLNQALQQNNLTVRLHVAEKLTDESIRKWINQHCCIC